MNVSIQDTYNRVWKLASVITVGAVPKSSRLTTPSVDLLPRN